MKVFQERICDVADPLFGYRGYPQTSGLLAGQDSTLPPN